MKILIDANNNKRNKLVDLEFVEGQFIGFVNMKYNQLR